MMRTLSLTVTAFLAAAIVRSSSFSAEGPPLRTGLWATQRVPESAAEMSEFESMVKQNSSLSGLYVHIGWKQLEKKSGKFDFSSLDRALEVLRGSKRKYVLGINRGAGTPPFVFQEGAQSIETRVNNPQSRHVWSKCHHSRAVGCKISGAFFPTYPGTGQALCG